jgi:hypothetical protein
LRSWRWASFCPKHVELILEINKTVIVESSWCSILLYLQPYTLLYFIRRFIELGNRSFRNCAVFHQFELPTASFKLSTNFGKAIMTLV